ncbi:transposon Tf2-8 polyprotein [Trichonephila clavipes]|uniref:Transposon Tf2-8 polyprotein n=1 Tax=Trichonephila clavipes TaxID=2585209 RepID=A0A8X6VPX8_TRICX|nr:transposon Tf2-8 polyprotein [Trichonephila clavipes]
MQISAENLQGELDLRHVENRQIKKELEKLIQDYKPEKTASTDVTMRIILKDEEPVCQPPRRLAFTERQEVNKQIEEWLNEGIIRPSSAEYASPIVMPFRRLCKKELITRIARWTLQLEEFDYEIEHRAGSRMKHIDALSRYPVMMVCNDTLTSKLKKAQEEDDNIQTLKSLLEKQESEEFLSEMESIPLSTYHVDFIGPLPSTNKSYQHIFTVVDAFTKFTWLYPVKTVSAESALEKLKQQQKTFGNPIRIISDRGSAFTSKLFNDYCDEENIQHLQIATGVPRGNGQVERIHRTLIPVLANYH